MESRLRCFVASVRGHRACNSRGPCNRGGELCRVLHRGQRFSLDPHLLLFFVSFSSPPPDRPVTTGFELRCNRFQSLRCTHVLDYGCSGYVYRRIARVLTYERSNCIYSSESIRIGRNDVVSRLSELTIIARRNLIERVANRYRESSRVRRLRAYDSKIRI